MVLTVAQTAERLGVTHERVRQLIASHTLRARRFGRVWMVDDPDAERLASVARPPGRPLGPRTAWDEITRLEQGGRAPDEHALAVLAARLRGRSARERFHVHPGGLARMRGDRTLVLGGATAAAAHGAPVVAGPPVDAYLAAGNRAAFIEYYLPVEGPPNLVLRGVPDEAWPFGDNQSYVGPVVALLDLVDAADRSVAEALSIWPRA